MIRLALILLICVTLAALALVQTASALNPDDEEYWTDVGSATLYKSDTYTFGDYTVKFVDYEMATDPASMHHELGGDHVILQLKRGDLVLNESVLNATCANASDTSETVCDELIWEDEIKIEIYTDLDEYPQSDPIRWQNPFININVLERAKPEISVDISASCEAYTAQDSEIRVTIDIENDGDALLRNVRVTVDPGELELIRSDPVHFGNISEDEDEETTCYAWLRVPEWINETEGQLFTISANVTGFDVENVMYNESASTEILVLPRWNLKIKKTVPRYISMDQTVWVRLDLKNTGTRDLDVWLNDTVPEGFLVCGNETPGWRFNITPSESLRFSYHIKPKRPGVFEIPGAVADFTMDGENVSILSNSPVITVDGAYIIVNKTAYPDTVSLVGAVTVTLSITNTGDRDAVVDLTDVIPSGAELVSGNRTLHAVLGANQTNKTEYKLRFSVPGTVTLDPPKISITSRDYSYITTSEMPAIRVIGSPSGKAGTSASDPESVGGQDGSGTTKKLSVDAPLLELLLVACMLVVVYLISRFM